MPNIIIQLKNNQLMEHCCQYLCRQNIAHKRLSRLNAVSLPKEKITVVLEEINRRDIELITEDTKIQLIVGQHLRTKRRKKKRSIIKTVHVPWGIKRIGVHYASIPERFYRPSIAVLDSGLSKHPSLTLHPTVVNFSNEKSPYDLHGHGTHIAGIIGGSSPINKKTNYTFRGVYPGLPLTSVKAFGQDGLSSLSAIIQGVEWCMDNHIRVINMSFGVQHHHPMLHEIIKLAYLQGIIMIAASGNEGKPGLTFPARYPEVISVGSINKENQVSSFSQFGTNLDIVAPGENIISTWPKQRYATLSGTSMSCAHVTGAIAIMLALQPALTPKMAKEYLLANTERLHASFLLQGHGLVSVKKIIAYLK